MITQFYPSTDISEKVYGRLYEELRVRNIAPGIEVKCYMLRYFSSTKFTKPKSNKVQISTNVFKNKNKTRPKITAKRVFEDNYVVAVLEDVDVSHVTQYKKTKNGKYIAYIPKGTPVVIRFSNGQASKPKASFILST